MELKYQEFASKIYILNISNSILDGGVDVVIFPDGDGSVECIQKSKCIITYISTQHISIHVESHLAWFIHVNPLAFIQIELVLIDVLLVSIYGISEEG